MKGVDTNVLVRFLTRDDARQEKAALQFLELAKARVEPILVNVVVLCELVWVLRGAYEYPKAEIADAVERLLSTKQLVIEDADLIWLALRDFRASKADFADCVIGRKNQKLGCDVTVTFDGRLAGVHGFAPVSR